MATLPPGGSTRVELWLPTDMAEFATEVAKQKFDRRKTYLEKLVIEHLRVIKESMIVLKQKEIPFKKRKQVKKSVKKKVVKRKK